MRSTLAMMRVLYFRSTSCVLRQLRHTGSQPSPVQLSNTVVSGIADKDSSDGKNENNKQSRNTKGTLISAAFLNLKKLGDPIDTDDSVMKMITEAKNVDELLSVVSVKKITRNHALKMVSVLADWTVDGHTQTTEFEKDSRFLVVCRVLGSNPMKGKAPDAGSTKSQETSTDLMTVLGVASDGEAAKLISNIDLGQMIKVLSTLANKKRRSTLLLRSLAFNIASSKEKLDIKQGADALYAVSTLNYHDELLLEKVCSDLCDCIMENKKRAVIGSIITSLGLMRHKHIELLNLLCEWVQANIEVCNTEDLVSLLLTLAMLNHSPQDTLVPALMSQLLASGVPNSLHWLDVIWSLSVLKKETVEQLASVLAPEFLDKITAVKTEGLSVSRKYKLLNLNAVARLRRTDDYSGPLLELDSELWSVPLVHNKQKQLLVTSLQEAMLNLLPSSAYLNTNVTTDMGFVIDAECVMTVQLKPLPLFDKKTKQPIDRTGPDMQKGIKVAIMVNDFFDLTRGRRELTGPNVLHQELLRLQGYRVMNVDHVDFNLVNKLVDNVQYLNQQLKNTIKKS